jgi:DNA adenine methylase
LSSIITFTARSAGNHALGPVGILLFFTNQVLKMYNADVFDDNEQVRLSRFVDEISAAGAKVIISNSDPKFIDKNDNFFEHLYGKYNINKVKATRMIYSDSDKRGEIHELLISNY